MFDLWVKLGWGKYAQAHAVFNTLEVKMQEKLQANVAFVERLIDPASNEAYPPEVVLQNLVYLITNFEKNWPSLHITAVQLFLRKDKDYDSLIIEMLHDPHKIISLVERLNSLNKSKALSWEMMTSYCDPYRGVIRDLDDMWALFKDINSFILLFETSAAKFFALPTALQVELFVHKKQIENLIKDGNLSFDFFLNLPDLVRIELLLISCYSKKEEKAHLIDNCAKSAILEKNFEIENANEKKNSAIEFDFKDSNSYYQSLPRELKEMPKELIGLPQFDLSSRYSPSYKNSFIIYEKLFLEIGVNPHYFVVNILAQTNIIEKIDDKYKLGKAKNILKFSMLEIKSIVNSPVFSEAALWVELFETPLENFELLTQFMRLEEILQFEPALRLPLLGEKSSLCAIKLLKLISVELFSLLEPEVKIELLENAAIVQPFLQIEFGENYFKTISQEMKILLLNNLALIAKTQTPLWLFFEDRAQNKLDIEVSNELVKNFPQIKRFMDKLFPRLPESNQKPSIIFDILVSALERKKEINLNELLEELMKIDFSTIATPLRTPSDEKNICDIAIERIESRKRSCQENSTVWWNSQFFPPNKKKANSEEEGRVEKDRGCILS